MSVASPQGRIIVGNVYSDLMIDGFVPGHSGPLVNVSPRKIWLAGRGDVVVSMRPVRPELASYVADVLSADVTGIDVVLVDRSGVDHELDNLLTASGRDFVLCPYAVDRRMAALSRRLNVPMEGYDGVPAIGLAERIHALNTKSGFRDAAGRLGLNIPAGVACDSLDSLRMTVRDMLSAHANVIVKFDRSSNGFGNLVLSRAELDGVDSRLEAHLHSHPGPSPQFVVEEFLPFVSLPSVEMIVDGKGVRLSYICDQRAGPQGGMIAPHEGLPARAIDALLAAGRVYGEYLSSLGYRGVFDVDGGCLAGGEVCFTESNVRRTAGSHLHEIACRLLGEQYQRDRCWASGSIKARRCHGFSRAVEMLRDEELAYDEGTRVGVIFPVDEPRDEKCFYQIFARSNAEAFDIERRLAALI